ncbi:MAG: hypothetical protein IJ468_15510 [Lachnospiraceae bacterium]|nr:hypothetical protein [Lachnospiraceae bacterium]
MELQELFQNPPAEYRVKPFWFWNGEMSREEIRRQLKEMADKGIGGAFICARQGLTVPYLSREWMDLVKYACETAKEFGVEAWLYDEYPYPSGVSGGEVLLEHPDAEQMTLKHVAFEAKGGTLIEKNLGWARVLTAKAYPMTDGDEGKKADWTKELDLRDDIGNLQTKKVYQRTGLSRYNQKRFFSYGPEMILRTTLPEGTWQVEVFLEEPLGDFKYYGKFFDPCHKEAVKTFLETTHERYEKALGEQMKDIHGIFSDEVGLYGGVPWSKRLPAAFRQRKGYDLLSVLPALYHSEFPDAARIRYDLYDVVHHLFDESFHKQVSDWCNDHDLLYATEVPSVRRTTQARSTIVGGDTCHEKLGKPLDWIYDNSIGNFRCSEKSVSALARQYDRKYAMIESFHSVGWSMTLQDARWMLDRLGCNGINFYVFHAFYYTIQDITKHDAPPSQFLQNPYWKHYRKLGDYAGRLSVLVSNTEADISIAVMDPTAALWSVNGNTFTSNRYQGESPEEEKTCTWIREKWMEICKELRCEQLDYDHLDTETLEAAEVKDGRIRIGRAAYSVVVVPPVRCMEVSAAKKLEEFVRGGGCLIGVEELPHVVIDEDKNPKETWEKLFDAESVDCESGRLEPSGFRRNAHFLCGEDAVSRMVQLCRENCGDAAARRVAEGNRKDLMSCTRIDPDGNLFLFAVNQGKNDAVLTIDGPDYSGCQAEEWRLEDGQIRKLSGFDGRISLGSYESRWIVLRPTDRANQSQASSAEATDPDQACQPEAADPNQACRSEVPVIRIPFTGEKAVQIEGKNICRFGQIQMSLDQKEWKWVMTEPFIDQCRESGLLQGSQLSYEGGFGIPKSIGIVWPLKCCYKAEFLVTKLPKEAALLLDRETAAGQTTVYINRKKLPKERFHPVFVNDHNNQAAEVLDLLQDGANEILFEMILNKPEEGLRDPFYLWGDFGVEPSATCPVLAEMPKTTEISHQWMKGFPYYSGTFRFRGQAVLPKEAEGFCRLELELPGMMYDCLELLIDGRSLGVKAYAPYRWEMEAGTVKQGVHEMEVRLTNTLANMLDGTWFDYENHQLVSVDGIELY